MRRYHQYSSQPSKTIQHGNYWETQIRFKTNFFLTLALSVCFSVIFIDAISFKDKALDPPTKNTMTGATANSGAAHSEATLALAKKESAEHMHGMQELYDEMRKRPLIVKAYALDDPTAPADSTVVHFVRHGQGFHNLMADIASSEGREWVQVNQRSTVF